MTDIKNPAGIDCCSIAYTVRHKQVVPNYRFGFMVTSLLLNSLLVGCQCYCKRVSKLVYSFTCNTLTNSQATCLLVHLQRTLHIPLSYTREITVAEHVSLRELALAVMFWGSLLRTWLQQSKFRWGRDNPAVRTLIKFFGLIHLIVFLVDNKPRCQNL